MDASPRLPARQVSDRAPRDSHAVVLVEGVSDQIAVEALAALLGRDLASEGVVVVPMGGAHAVGRFLGNGGRKIGYMPFLIDALGPARAPRPLRLVLARV